MSEHELGNRGALVRMHYNNTIDADISDRYGDGHIAALNEQELEDLYEVLDDHFGEDEHNEGQQLKDNRDVYDWFDPSASNVTCLTDGDRYDVDKYLFEGNKTSTLVRRIGHHYDHVQLHEKEVSNLRDVWDNGDGAVNETTYSEEKGCGVDLKMVSGDEDAFSDVLDALQYQYHANDGEIDESSVETDICVCGQEHEDPVNPRSSEDESTSEVDEAVSEWLNVVLAMSVDIEGASTEQKTMYAKIARMVEQNFETFVNKNISYGSSFMNTEVGLGDDGPFDDSVEANANGLLVRMNDKQHRLENLLFGGEELVGESVKETAMDLANYSLMLAYVVDENGSDN